VFDMCRYQGLQQALCDQLQAYTDACLSAGAPVHQWREPDFCRESDSLIGCIVLHSVWRFKHILQKYNLATYIHARITFHIPSDKPALNFL